MNCNTLISLKRGTTPYGLALHKLILILAENDYPPVDRDEVFKEIFEQSENIKRCRGV